MLRGSPWVWVAPCAALVVAVGACSGTSGAAAESDAGPSRALREPGRADAAPSPAGDCAESVGVVKDLGADLGGFGTAEAQVARALGTFTNHDGDVLDLEPVGAVTWHGFTGTGAPEGGPTPSACESQSYLAVRARMSLRTRDGRLDETTEVDVRLRHHGAHFTAALALSGLRGAYRPTSASAGSALDVTADYGAPSPEWDVYAMVNEPAADGGGTELVHVSAFVTRTRRPAWDAGAPP
jgi:hypothetical protein